MNPHGLLAILEKEKEKYVLQHNNEKQFYKIIKIQNSFNYIIKNIGIVLAFFYFSTSSALFFIFLNVFIFGPILSFIDPLRDHVIIGRTIILISFMFSILCSGLLLKAISKFLFSKRINQQQNVHFIIEEKFYGENISDEVLSYLKVILTDDEYFELMKDKKDITNKKAFDIAEFKIHKEDILMDKKNLVLDLKKLNEYKIQVNS